MGGFLRALIRNPMAYVSLGSGLVTILGVAGILAAPIEGVLQGLLSVVLGLGIAASVTAAHTVIEKRAVARALAHRKEQS